MICPLSRSTLIFSWSLTWVRGLKELNFLKIEIQLILHAQSWLMPPLPWGHTEPFITLQAKKTNFIDDIVNFAGDWRMRGVGRRGRRENSEHTTKFHLKNPSWNNAFFFLQFCCSHPTLLTFPSFILLKSSPLSWEQLDSRTKLANFSQPINTPAVTST